MSAVTWCSSWSVSDVSDVDVQLLGEGVVSLSSLPLHLTRPEDDVSIPCQISLVWVQQPLRCSQMQLEVQCSARHVEIYMEGAKRNLLGEEEKKEVYLGTFRGTKQSAESQLFAMTPSFKLGDKDCDVLKNVQTLRIKFVSLLGSKSVLNLQEFRCVFEPIEPIIAIDSSSASLTATIAGLSLDTDAAPSMQTLLRNLQQTMEQEMETKIARAIDAKMATLAERLALSEQALFHLHKKMDTKDTNVQASLNQIKQKCIQLEEQLSQFSVTKEAEQRQHNDPDQVAAGATHTEEVVTAEIEMATDDK